MVLNTLLVLEMCIRDSSYQAYCIKKTNNGALFKASEVETGKINYNGSIYIHEYKITDEGFKLPTTNPAYINNACLLYTSRCV